MRRLPLALLVWAAAVLGAVELSSAVAGSIHTTPGSASSGDSADATATSKGSLFTPAAFGKALSVIQSHVGADAHVQNVAVYPGYLSVEAIKGSSEVDVTSYTDGRFVTVSSSYIPTNDPLLRLSTLKAGDTAAVASRVTRAAHISLSQLRYMIPQLDPITHRFQWLVFLVPGSKVTYFQVPAGRGRVLEQTAGGGLRPVGR